MTAQHQTEPVEAAAAAARSRALVVIESRYPKRSNTRREAFFLTQLIACEQRLPPYREARKAEPTTATTAYGRSATFSPARVSYII